MCTWYLTTARAWYSVPIYNASTESKHKKLGAFTPSAISHRDFPRVGLLLLDVHVLPIPFRPVLLSGEDGAQRRQRGGQGGGPNPHLMAEEASTYRMPC